MRSDIRFWIGFSHLPGIGSGRLRQIVDLFGGDLERAWGSPQQAFLGSQIPQRALATALSYRSSIDLAQLQERVHRAQVNVITMLEPTFPELLKATDDAPPLLYFRGTLLPQDSLSIGIVGTRAMTPYGRDVTRHLVTGLVRHNVTIVSGLARGVDAVAHTTALDEGGRTIAVFASGVDIIYPSEHRRLAQRIVDDGAIVSEYPVGAAPDAGNFPARNRVISGLSLGTLVVEAGERSGALITARRALEQNREVFAVPGPITSMSSIGANRLIRDGEAKLVLTVDDILDELNIKLVPQQLEIRELMPANDLESVLFGALTSEPQHIDELTRKLALPSSTITGTLAIMELKGMVRQSAAMHFVTGW